MLNTEAELRRRYGEFLNTLNIHLVRSIARQVGVDKPTNGRKEELISKIIDVLTLVTPPVPISKLGAPLKETTPDPKYIDKLKSIKEEYESLLSAKKKEVVLPLEQGNSMAVNAGYSLEEQIDDPRVGFFKGLLELSLTEGVIHCAKEQTDIFFTKEFIQDNHLKNADKVVCQKETDANGKNYAVKIFTVNNKSYHGKRIDYEQLEAIYPKNKIVFPESKGSVLAKILNRFIPVCMGQRIYVSVPVGCDTIRFGSVLIRLLKEAKGNYAFLSLLNVEAPEAMTRFKEKAGDVELFYSSFDESSSTQLSVAELAFARAMRLAEDGKNVIIFSEWFSPFFEDRKEQFLKFFSYARATEKFGSITLFAVVKDGGKNEEFSSYANCRIYFDQELSKKHIYPPINLTKSYTDNEEEILSEEECRTLFSVRERAEKEGSGAIIKEL